MTMVMTMCHSTFAIEGTYSLSCCIRSISRSWDETGVVMLWGQTLTSSSSSTFVSFIGVLWLVWWLDRRKALQRNLDLVLIQYLLKLLPLLLSHLVVRVDVLWLIILHIVRYKWLFSCIIDINGLVWSIFGPVIILLIVIEVIDIEHMPEINKAVASTSLFWLILVHR